MALGTRDLIVFSIIASSRRFVHEKSAGTQSSGSSVKLFEDVVMLGPAKTQRPYEGISLEAAQDVGPIHTCPSTPNT